MDRETTPLLGTSREEQATIFMETVGKNKRQKFEEMERLRREGKRNIKAEEEKKQRSGGLFRK